MNATRFDLYAEIHKAIRRELCDWTERLGKLDASNSTAVHQTRSDFTGLSDLLETHARHEERWVHPLLKACAPELEKALEDEHAGLDERFADVVQTFDQLSAGDSKDPWALSQALYRKFAAFCGHYFLHQAREENDAMPALQAAHDDGALMEVSNAIRGSLTPDEMNHFLGKMIPAMNVHEQAGMLLGIKASAPREVFDGVIGLAATCLAADEMTALQHKIAG